MDIYTNPTKNTYVTGITKLFMMPTDSGGIPAVAVSKKASMYISSTYTILMILIFMVGWKLILAVIMAYWPTKGDPNRETALVALWNSGECLNAAMLMVSYCKGMITHMVGGEEESGQGGGKKTTDGSSKGTSGIEATTTSVSPELEKQEVAEEVSPASNIMPAPTSSAMSAPTSKVVSDRSNLWWGILFLSLAAAMAAGNIVSGILVPVQLSMGNFVPPAKDKIFYPDPRVYIRDDDNGAGLAKLNSLKAPSALRALGSIEASDVTVRKRVNIVRLDPPGGDKRWAGLDYDYEVTGVDMGLQSDPKLALRVKGSCHTDYSWVVNGTNSTAQEDIYQLFGGDTIYKVNRPVGAADLPPMVHFEIDSKPGAGFSNTSYAMIVNTAGHLSYTSGPDPWYFTEKSPPNTLIAYQVAPRRPVLSCWETRIWHLNGKEAEAVKLSTLPGLNLDKLWSETVLPLEFAVPRLITLGRVAGPAALKSAAYTMPPVFILDAEASSIHGDLERLVLAGWVSSRNVIRDTATYEPGPMQNLAKGPGGSVPDSAAKFVLQSGEVDTLSVRILIAIPAILLFLHVVEGILYCVLRRSPHGEKAILPKPYGKKNVMDLLATHLYKELYKKIRSPGDWAYEDSDVPLLFTSPSETNSQT